MSFQFSLIGCPVTEKLSKNNFPLWSMQVLSALRGCQLEHYIEPEAEAPPKKIAKDAAKPTELTDNPEYKEWVAKDQQIVNYLLSSISKEVKVQVSSCTTSAEMWRVIVDMTASQSRGRIINTRMALATAHKGSSTIGEYFSKMKSLADDMASAGKRLEDEEIASFILAGLDAEYNPIVSSITGRVEKISLGELYTQLVSWEQRIDLQTSGGSGSSVNTATHGGRGGFKRGGGGRGRGRGRSNNGNNGRPQRNNNGDNFICQLCGKEGHTAIRCFKRFDASFTGAPEQRSAAAATNSYGVDTNWYTDTGATDHITGDLEKLTMRDKYHGNDQVHTANGAGMRINQVGQSFVRTPKRNLVLNNVLYIPEASKSLASVHRLTSDNDAFIEFHPDYFLIKDQATKRTLLRGGCEGGLYPLKSSSPTNKAGRLVRSSCPHLRGIVVWVIHHLP